MKAAVAFDHLARGESPAEPADSLQLDNPERLAGNVPAPTSRPATAATSLCSGNRRALPAISV